MINYDNSGSVHISEIPSWLRNLGIKIDPTFEKSEWFPGLLPIWWSRGKVDYSENNGYKPTKEDVINYAINCYIHKDGRIAHFIDVIDDNGTKLWRFNVRGQLKVFTLEALLSFIDDPHMLSD